MVIEHIVDYIQRNISEYPVSQIRRELENAGYLKSEIDTAFYRLIHPPIRVYYVVLGVTGAVLSALVICILSLSNFAGAAKQAAQIVDANQVSEYRPKTVAYQAGKGFAVLMPDGYQAKTDSKTKTSETILMGPKAAQLFADDEIVAKSKTLKLEAVFNDRGGLDAQNYLSSLKQNLEKVLTKNKTPFKTEMFDGPFPSFKIIEGGATPKLRIYAVGKHLVYRLTCSVDNHDAGFIMLSLAESDIMETPEGEIKSIKSEGERIAKGLLLRSETVIPLPSTLNGASFADNNFPNTELAYIFPYSVDISAVMKQKKLEKGVIRGIIEERKFYSRDDVLHFKTEYEDILLSLKSRCSVKWERLPGCPVLLAECGGVVPHYEAAIISKKQVFRLFSADNSENFKYIYKELAKTAEPPKKN